MYIYIYTYSLARFARIVYLMHLVSLPDMDRVRFPDAQGLIEVIGSGPY